MEVILNQSSPVATCHYDGKTQVVKDNSHRLSVGISHYHKNDDGSVQKSYVQVHQTMHCSTREKAVKAAHRRIDQHKDLPHGEFDAKKLNPVGEFPDDLVKGAALYHPSPVAWSSLPQVDAISGESIENDVYVPHVDDSSRGKCYQDIYMTARGITGDLNTATMGTATLENAITLAHKIVDEIIQADYNGERV